MPNTPEREAIRAVVHEVLVEQAHRSPFRRLLQRVVDVAQSERAGRWTKYAIMFGLGTAVAHALGW